MIGDGDSLRWPLAAVMAFTLLSCGANQQDSRSRTDSSAINKTAEDTMAASGKFLVMSTAFKEGEAIPKEYTADGKNISPPLRWESVPAGTKSFALVADDPDAPMGTWVHWVIFNIPSGETGLAEHVPTTASLPDGALQGTNGSHEIGYDGPSPPSGTHRYYFKLYALDAMLKLSSGITKPELLKAMEGHIRAQAQTMGRYSRK